MAPAVKYLGNIVIGPESTAYQQEVRRYLDLIRTTETGRSLFRHINLRPTSMTIVPFVPTKEVPVNASADPDNFHDAMPIGHQGVGTGKGTAVVIKYHPATFRQLNKNLGYIPAGGGPGEALFHEMVHGYRQQRGIVLNQVNFGDDPADEFYAVLASNVYRSERGFTQLRASWRTRFTPMAKHMADSEFFYEDFKAEIDQWFAVDRAFCMDVARVKTRFNPFQAAAISLGLMKAPGVPMRLP